MYPLTQVEVLQVLAKHRVPFVVVGGSAVYVYGHQRSTEDVDVIWRRTPESELLLLDALTELKAEWITNEIDPATRIEKTKSVSLAYIRSTPLMMLITTGGFVDLFDFIPGYPKTDVELVFQNPTVQQDIAFVSIDWLRNMKQAAGRPKDLEDLRELERLHPPEP